MNILNQKNVRSSYNNLGEDYANTSQNKEAMEDKARAEKEIFRKVV